MNALSDSPLGHATAYVSVYSPELLFPISREENRKSLGIEGKLPFFGVDVWHAYEISWLDKRGKPKVAMATFTFDCESPFIIESKSFKLYLVSFNATSFESLEEVKQVLTRDLSTLVGSHVQVDLRPLGAFKEVHLENLPGRCIDDLEVTCEVYKPEPSLLSAGNRVVEEQLHSHLLKSNCPVTGQPDWASIEIVYQGPEINREGLLRYIVSYRDHEEFHEQCVERIFMDVKERCCPTHLQVWARYTRRGGLDINPMRSTHPVPYRERRLLRQ